MTKLNKKEKVQMGVRWILTALLLWQVWGHSHWSVALSITLIFISIESIAILFKEKWVHWSD